MSDIKADFNLKEKVCESCGENFDCGANAEKCWCFEIDLSDEALENLKTDYTNCLCEKCLLRFRKKAE